MGVSTEHNYLPHANSFSNKYQYSLIEQSLVLFVTAILESITNLA